MNFMRIKRIEDGKYFVKWNHNYRRLTIPSFGVTGTFLQQDDTVLGHLLDFCHDWKMEPFDFNKHKQFEGSDQLKLVRKNGLYNNVFRVTDKPDWSRLALYEIELVIVTSSTSDIMSARDFLAANKIFEPEDEDFAGADL